MALNVPQSLIDRAARVGYTVDTKIVVNFVHPRGEPVTILRNERGLEDEYFSLATLESVIRGAEGAYEDFINGVL